MFDGIEKPPIPVSFKVKSVGINVSQEAKQMEAVGPKAWTGTALQAGRTDFERHLASWA